MGNAFRPQPGPAIYPENKTPVAEDLLEVGLLVAFSTIAFSFILIIPGIRGWEVSAAIWPGRVAWQPDCTYRLQYRSEGFGAACGVIIPAPNRLEFHTPLSFPLQRLWATVRVFVALFVGCVILVSNFGLEWFSDTKCVLTQYKAYIFPPNIHQEIEAVIGIHIGLREVNVTLKEMALADCLGDTSHGEAKDYYENRPFPGEDIEYEEEYGWSSTWGQMRIGFGRFSFPLNQEFRASQYRGTPLPILWVAEYFTLDGEQIRWGRKFRVAGWYTHILLW